MEVIPILVHLKEAFLCKGFGSTLTGSTLKWMLNVPPYSIISFAHLVNIFNNQLSCGRTFEKITSDLYRVVQDPRDFFNRFGREALSIPNIDMATDVEAFQMGLRKDSPFYEDLVVTPCKRLDEVRCRSLRFISIEEDKEVQNMSNPLSHYENSNRKDLGDKARWSKKDNKFTSWKDKSKWCAHHEDSGNMTNDCIDLRKEISYLLGKGHLK
ncbi:hypothetical protein Lser_V15G16767 [Lactuca serriola]